MDGVQRHGFDESEYERPNRWWKCGHAEEGEACHVGPDAMGRCQATYECSPARRGDRWECTRPDRRGGSCEHGPRPDGTCACRIEPCQPELTVRAKRGLATVGAAALTLGLALAVFTGPWFEDLRRSVLFPGELSRSHGVIEDCAACHVDGAPAGGQVAMAGAGAGAAGDSAGSAGDAGPSGGDTAAASDTAAARGGSGPHPGLDQSARCMVCHRPAGERPLRPHGLSPDTLRRVARALEEEGIDGEPPLALRLAALGPEPPTGPEEGLACATCHEEHRGRGHRLTAMDDRRCQACHTVQFDGFGRGHPELARRESGGDLAYGFDHGAHEAEHFPDEDAEFTCARCHGVDSDAGGMGERDFEAMCGDCHAEEIEEGALVAFQVPGVDYEILGENGVSVGTWPAGAGINVVTPLSPLMRALLAADSAAAEDLGRLRGVDLTYLQGLDAPTLRAAGGLAWNVKELFHDLSTGGREALADRLQEGLGVDLTEAEASALVDQRGVDESRPRRPGWLSAVRSVRESWLPGLAEELERREAGSTPPLDVLEDYAQPAPPPAGWIVDSFDFTVRYRPRGHADVFLRELVEVSGRAAPTDSQAAGLFSFLTSDDGPGSCAKCHGVSREDAADGGGVWEEGGRGPSLGRLTHFDHEPHMVAACQDCHRTGPEGGMRPTERQTCASCHDGDRAAGRCLNCHSYHSSGFVTGSEEQSVLHPPTPDSAGSESDTAATDTAAASNREGGDR